MKAKGFETLEELKAWQKETLENFAPKKFNYLNYIIRKGSYEH